MNMLKEREENMKLFNRTNMLHFHFSVSQWIHALNFKQLNVTKQATFSLISFISTSIFMCHNNRMSTNEHFYIVLLNIFNKVTLGNVSPQIL